MSVIHTGETTLELERIDQIEDPINWMAATLASANHKQQLPRLEAESNGGVMIRAYLRQLAQNYDPHPLLTRDFDEKPLVFKGITDSLAAGMYEARLISSPH